MAHHSQFTDLTDSENLAFGAAPSSANCTESDFTDMELQFHDINPFIFLSTKKDLPHVLRVT